jgi:hypothetical protein
MLLIFKKSMEPNKCIQFFFFMKMFIKVIPMIFQILMSLGKSRYAIPSGTTQGHCQLHAISQ